MSQGPHSTVDSGDVSAERALRRTQERIRTLVENLHVGVLVQDRDARILLSNAKALELLGVSMDQLLGRSSFDPSWNVIHEDGSEFPGLTHPVPVALQTAKPVRNVTMGVYRPALRDRVWLLVNAEPELDEQGGVVEVVCTFSDITDRKRLEASLLQAQKLEAVGRLAGGIAHDFNNLLTGIMGYIELAAQSTREGSTERADFALAREACLRAAALTRQLLAFARRDVSSPTVVSLSEAVSSMHNMLRRLIGEHVLLEARVAADIWPIRVDPAQLQQVILNLALNARDAMPAGGSLVLETTNIVLGEEYARGHADVAPGEYAMLAVSDTGQGIPAELQAHIFEPFFTTKPAHEGTGLGLATVHGVVRQHGGHIWLYSEVGRGTTFKVYFPRTAAGAAATPTAPPPAPALQHQATILLAEDEALVRGFAQRALELAGHQVLACADAREALERMRAHPGDIDIVLTDVVMPHISGRELAECVVAERPTTRILYTSGYTQDAILRHGVFDAGIAFLAKPYTAGELVARVAEVLAQARLVP